MSVKQVTVAAQECTCEECGHIWLTLARNLPTICPQCRTREWNGKKQNGRPFSAASTITMPKPKRGRR